MNLSIPLHRPSNHQEDFLLTKKKGQDNEQDKTVTRLFASYDMGWSQRSTGFKYDSLNGYCSLIVYKSGKVLNYCTKNILCRVCENKTKYNKNVEHDCRLNHFGTAKCMEADGAVQLVAHSKISQECNVEIEVLIGDSTALPCMPSKKPLIIPS